MESIMYAPHIKYGYHGGLISAARNLSGCGRKHRRHNRIIQIFKFTIFCVKQRLTPAF